ncbi:MAG: SCO family protein [Burkholderiales bacterium]|nr:SCO family protein [Burkholderiales bacterium]
MFADSTHQLACAKTRYAKSAVAAFAGLALALAMPAVHAHQNHAHPAQQAEADQAAGKVHIKVPDTVLTDQNGKSLRFRTEAMADRLVVINFVYTTCSTVCPVQSALFADVQKRLGERAGRDVALISVTVDPLRDTPARLKEFAAGYGAGPGWSLYTGSSQAVDEVLKAFDAYTANFTEHPPAVLVGDPRSGEWVRFFGFPSTEQILGRLTELQAGRQGARSAQAKAN